MNNEKLTAAAFLMSMEKANPVYIDNAFSSESQNPVQTKVITKKINDMENRPREKHYTAVWDKVHSQLMRANDAADITTNTENFAIHGSANANYNNPFDNIYPWCQRKICNVDVGKYLTLQSGSRIVECVKYWEGDAQFSYDDQNGVWVYTPEFWGKTWDDGTYRYFDVCDQEMRGYVHYPERIEGRWFGVLRTITVNGSSKTCLLPATGNLSTNNIVMREVLTAARNYGGTIESIHNVDATNMLAIVEYATVNFKNALGLSPVDLLVCEDNTVQENVTSGNVVKILASAGQGVCVPNAMFGVSTRIGDAVTGAGRIVSVQQDPDNSDLLDVTLDSTVTATTSNYWVLCGIINLADEIIGSKSGYCGVNGKSNVYYRGQVFYGNRSRQLLGVFKREDTNSIWIASNDQIADTTSGEVYTGWVDTGLAIPGEYTTDYESHKINAIGILPENDPLIEGRAAALPICTAIDADTPDPFGDVLIKRIIPGYTRYPMLFSAFPRIRNASGRFCTCYGLGEISNTWWVSAIPVLRAK